MDREARFPLGNGVLVGFYKVGLLCEEYPSLEVSRARLDEDWSSLG